VKACKQGVQAVPTLSSSTKGKIEAICNKAGSGDDSVRRKATQEICEELVNASPLPSGSSKDRALAACEKVGQGK